MKIIISTNKYNPDLHPPREEDAFHHVEILHEDISLRLGAEVANSISDAQLDCPFQGRRGGLKTESGEWRWKVAKRRSKRAKTVLNKQNKSSLFYMLSLHGHLLSCGRSSSHDFVLFQTGKASKTRHKANKAIVIVTKIAQTTTNTPKRLSWIMKECKTEARISPKDRWDGQVYHVK